MFAVIEIPNFALQAVLRMEPELHACAVAVTDQQVPARVRQMTPAAQQRGVTVGMTTTQALGRCPQLLFRSPSEQVFSGPAACLLQCAETFSPWIEATAEGVVTLEWHLAEGESFYDRGKAMVTHLAALGLEARVGVAQNADLALLAARCATPVRVVENAGKFLADLPIDAVEPPPHMRPILRRWGVRTLGILAALARDQLIERLGPEAGAVWDRAAGRSQRLLKLVRAPEIFAEAVELDHELETLEPLLFILRRFLEQLSARLEGAYRVASSLHLRLRFAGLDSKPYERELKIPAPTRDVPVLYRILETHLEGLTAEAPIVAVELSAVPTRQEQKQFALFESGLRDPNKFFETLARLQALLGNGRVGTPVLADTWRGDVFHLETPRFEGFEKPTVRSAQSPGLPLRRFRPPLPADVHLENGRPAAVFSERAFGPVRQSCGPWRTSGEWWSGQGWAREEWDVQLADSLYRLAREQGAWFLEGAYG